MYDQSVSSDGSFPVRLYDTNKHSTYFYDFNKNASEFYRGHENKLALYMIHDWDVTPKLNLYYGFRLESQKLKGVNAAVKNATGGLCWQICRLLYWCNCSRWNKNYTKSIDYNWFNYDVSAAATYKIN